jgi:hypothetical protein
MKATYRAAIFHGTPEETGDLITTIDIEADNSTDAKYRAEAAFVLSRQGAELPAHFWVYVFPMAP